MSEAVKLLREACAETSQKKVAKVLGYSATTINQVLQGIYPGDMEKVNKVIHLRLGRKEIACPILGIITPTICASTQAQPFSDANSFRVRQFKACLNCPNNTTKK